MLVTSGPLRCGDPRPVVTVAELATPVEAFCGEYMTESSPVVCVTGKDSPIT